MNISIPDQLAAFIEAQTAAEGLNNTSDYVAGLIEREQERLAQQARVEALLLNGLDSGDPVEATAEWWAAKRSRLLDQSSSERS